MKNLKIIFLLISLSQLGLVYAQKQSLKSKYQIVYEADKNGKAISGDLNKLIDYAQSGAPVRVGWVLEFKLPNEDKSNQFEHWADAGFITILNGHLFAQINPIAQQGPKFSIPPSINFIDGKPNGWLAIIGTTGVLEQRFSENDLRERMVAFMRKSGATEKQIEERLKSMNRDQVKTKWAVFVD